eukprot:2718971-Rhodomonas_salina.1
MQPHPLPNPHFFLLFFFLSSFSCDFGIYRQLSLVSSVQLSELSSSSDDDVSEPRTCAPRQSQRCAKV